MTTRPKLIFSDNKSFARSPSRSPKKAKSPVIDTTFILPDINTTALDREYALSEIKQKQERDSTKDNVKQITTCLTKLGISINKKEPAETIVWGEKLKINLFVSTSESLFDINERKLKCSWCHQFPPIGSKCLAVPFQYVPSYIQEQVYAPECVNVVEHMASQEKKVIDPKNAPKSNYFRRDLSSFTKNNYDADRISDNEYFVCAFPVCSFNCMLSKGNELSIQDARFRNVNMFIYFMYDKLFGKLPTTKIIPAPSPMILQDYGGPFTVDEYRNSFKIICVENTNQIFFNKTVRYAKLLFAQNDQ